MSRGFAGSCGCRGGTDGVLYRVLCAVSLLQVCAPALASHLISLLFPTPFVERGQRATYPTKVVKHEILVRVGGCKPCCMSVSVFPRAAGCVPRACVRRRAGGQSAVPGSAEPGAREGRGAEVSTCVPGHPGSGASVRVRGRPGRRAGSGVDEPPAGLQPGQAGPRSRLRPPPPPPALSDSLQPFQGFRHASGRLQIREQERLAGTASAVLYFLKSTII